MAEPVRARRLSDEEGRRLLQIVRRGKHGTVRVRRALIIMASASGTLVPAIARLVEKGIRLRTARWQRFFFNHLFRLPVPKNFLILVGLDREQGIAVVQMTGIPRQRADNC